jgi:uncharacterized protein YpmS
MFYRQKPVVILTVIVLIITTIACNLLIPKAPKPTPTPISTAEIQALQTEVYSAVATVAQGGKIDLEFTEAQLTATANAELQQQNETRISNLQIGLQSGLVKVTGQVNQAGFELPLAIDMSITVDSQGKPHTQVVSGRVSGFSIPESTLAQMTTEFDQMLASQLQAYGDNLVIESLTIADGKIHIVAHTS